MKHFMRPLTVARVLVVVLALIASVACTSPTSSDSKVSHVAISSVDWVIENIDRSFWSQSPGFDGLFYDFWISYTGTLNLSDIRAVRIKAADNSYWTLYPTQSTDPAEFVYPEESTIGGWGRWYIGQVESYALPLGSLTAIVEYNDGTLVTGQITSHEPGASTAPSHTYVVNDITKAGLDGTTAALALGRPAVTQASRSGSAISVSLAQFDTLANNGWLVFYNSSGNPLGTTKAFRNMSTGSAQIPVSFLNSSTVQVTSADISSVYVGTAASVISDASTVIPVIIDGEQYSGTWGRYDYLSRGARASITN